MFVCRGFRHVICPIITFIISFQREKVLEMFHHAYNSYMVSKLLKKRERFAHKQELRKCSFLTFIDRYGSKDVNTPKFNEVSWGKESGIVKNSNSVVVFMTLISRVLTSAEETQLSVYRLTRKNVSLWLELLRRVKVRNRGYITKHCFPLSLKSLRGANSVKDINLTEKYEQIFFVWSEHAYHVF